MEPLLTAAEYQRIITGQNTGYQYLWLLTLLVMLCGYSIYWLRKKPDTPQPAKEKPGILVNMSDNHFGWFAIIAGGTLRIFLLYNPLWYDEAFTAAMVRAPDFWTALAGDVHPPGYYLLAKIASLPWGATEQALRMPSLIASMLLIEVIYRLTMAYTDDKVTARIAALITIFLPAMTLYSTEARYPMMLAMAALTAVMAARDNRPALFALAAGGCAWLHATGILYCAVLCIAAVVYHRYRWWKWSAIAVIITMPCVYLAMQQAHDVSDGFWLLESNPLWHIIDMTILRKKYIALLIPLSYVPLIALTIAGLWSFRHRLRDPFIVALTALPFICWLVSLVWHPIYLSRTLIAPVLLIVMMWSVYLRQSGRLPRLVLIAVVLVSLIQVYMPKSESASLPDVFSRCTGADVVYATSTHMAINAMYYSPAPVIVWHGGDGISQTLPTSAKLAMGMKMTAGIGSKELRGNVCVVEMVNYLTTWAEYSHVAAMERIYHPTVEIIPFNGLLHYRILRFRA